MLQCSERFLAQVVPIGMLRADCLHVHLHRLLPACPKDVADGDDPLAAHAQSSAKTRQVLVHLQPVLFHAVLAARMPLPGEVNVGDHGACS